MWKYFELTKRKWFDYKKNNVNFGSRQYKFKKNERILAMFNEFDDVLSEEAMWQVSESIKPRGGRNRAPPAHPTHAAHAQTAAWLLGKRPLPQWVSNPYLPLGSS